MGGLPQHAETLRVFFHHFCKKISSQFDIYCHAVCTDVEIDLELLRYAKLGFPGCVASGDGVHIP